MNLPVYGSQEPFSQEILHIPKKELEAATFTIAHAERLEESLKALIVRKVLIVDSSIVLSWIGAGQNAPLTHYLSPRE